MRTTLSVDHDGAALLKQEMRKSGRPRKQVGNDRLRLSYTAKQTPRRPFKVKPWNLQPPAGLSFDKVEELEQWLKQPKVRIVVPGDDHWRLLRTMILEGHAFGPMIRNAQIAALTIEYGAVLYPSDRDFAQFPGLRRVNPLSHQVQRMVSGVRFDLAGRSKAGVPA